MNIYIYIYIYVYVYVLTPQRHSKYDRGREPFKHTPPQKNLEALLGEAFIIDDPVTQAPQKGEMYPFLPGISIFLRHVGYSR